jgi:hypothetical protein
VLLLIASIAAFIALVKRVAVSAGEPLCWRSSATGPQRIVTFCAGSRTEARDEHICPLNLRHRCCDMAPPANSPGNRCGKPVSARVCGECAHRRRRRRSVTRDRRTPLVCAVGTATRISERHLRAPFISAISGRSSRIRSSRFGSSSTSPFARCPGDQRSNDGGAGTRSDWRSVDAPRTRQPVRWRAPRRRRTVRVVTPRPSWEDFVRLAFGGDCGLRRIERTGDAPNERVVERIGGRAAA